MECYLKIIATDEDAKENTNNSYYGAYIDLKTAKKIKIQ
jgi:hypothetical protein